MSLVQAKNSLMGACSSKHLQVQSTQTEVICLQNDIEGPRQRDIERVVNDEFSSKLQIVMQFKLQDKNSTVIVIANTYAQYLVPVSVLSSLQTRTKNLLDDLSHDELKAVLLEAGASD
jgi:riboflavin biosynthesis pyrimidine reductase